MDGRLSPGSRSRTIAAAATLVTLLVATSSAAASTYYVSPSGSDANACAQVAPCRQIRRALTLVGPGDTILVADGSYLGFDVRDLDGAPGSPITIRAQGTGAQVTPTTDRSDNRDTIFITYSSYIVIDGLRSFGAVRAAVRVDQSPKVTIRNGVFGNNTAWGIFTDFSDDLLLEGNECYGSLQQHGIYVSNSGDRPVVRANRVHDNVASGIQLNADASQGGDGLITGAVIEDNVIYNNGTIGAAAINLDGVQDSIVRNNLLYNNHSTGIVNYQGDGAAGPKGMKILNNTVDQAANGRYALLIWGAAGTNVVRNNILYHPSTSRGSITYLSAADVLNTDSDYNVITRVTPNDGGSVFTLAEWQAQGHELHSITATPSTLFVAPAAANYRLAPSSPAIDRGQAQVDVPRDIEGRPRPAGAGWDLGAYEGAGAGAIQISIGDVSLNEGQSGSASATFTVSLTGASSQTVSVSYATANGTATAGSDYTAVSGSLSFTPGQTSKAVAVLVLGDTAIENNEAFVVNLSGATNATILDGQATGTILNDDVAGVSLSINNVNVAEGQSGTTNAVLTVALSAASTQTVTVGYATANGTATAGSDYTAQTGNLSFTAGQTSKTISVVVGGDTTVEPNETFVVNLTSPVGATITDSQGQGTITNDDTPPPTGVAVVWTSAVGVTVTGNSLTKTASTAWGNAGAISTNQIASGDGYVEFTASETTTYRMLGLSNGNTNASYEDIDFAIYQYPGQIQVYESGTLKGSFGSYAAGNALRVAVVGGVVKYSKNGVVFYTSTKAPTYPLLVDAALYNQGATLNNAVLSGASAPPLPSGSVPVVWTSAVGVTVTGNSLAKTAATAWGNAGAISTNQIASGDGYVEFTASETTTYRLLGLSNGNTNTAYEDIDFAIDAYAGGQIKIYENGALKGTFGTYAAGDTLRVAVVGGVVKYSKNGVVFYTSTTTPTYPLLVDTALYNQGATLNNAVLSGASAPPPSGSVPVVWTSAVGVTVTGNSLTKTAANGWGNAGAVSTQQLASGDGYVEFTASETNTYRLLGLSNGNTNTAYEDIDFAIDAYAGGQVKVYENGALKGTFGTYATGDKLRIGVVGSSVRYYKNGSVVYTSTKVPTYPLLVDTALYNTGSTLSNVVISGAP